MWHRAATRRTCGAGVGLPTHSWGRWAASVQRRCKASTTPASSTKGFRAGTVDATPFQVKPNFNVPVWQPSAKYMKYKPVRWLSDNLFAIATYQLTLEVGLSVIFGSLLYADVITAQGVYDALAAYRYPFLSWVDVEGGVYTEPVHIGPFALKPEKLTALHTGHNIASGLLPVQVLVLVCTFAPAKSAFYRLRGAPPPRGAAAEASASAATPAAASATAETQARAAHGGVRRASYARVGSSAKATRMPPRPF